ncbi:hypothetical protein ACFQ3H_03070 [Paralysiella testudinis]|uniref:hypothetical protein n=1 Tax=Paralysiella testudinis TaxID=2809020 RepID=UPI003624B2B3
MAIGVALLLVCGLSADLSSLSRLARLIETAGRHIAVAFWGCQALLVIIQQGLLVFG